MQKGPGRFELILNLPEMIVLFFVMVTLFTGLLFFGYRVGYRQSAKAVEMQSAPAAPVQESPQVDQQAPATQIEPELRLENVPPKPGEDRWGPAEFGLVGLGVFPPAQPMGVAGLQVLAVLAGEAGRLSCEDGFPRSPARQGAPGQSLRERVATSSDTAMENTPPLEESGQEPQPAATAESKPRGAQSPAAETLDCGIPAAPGALRSIAC